MSCCFRTKLVFSDEASFKTGFLWGDDASFSLTFSEAGGRRPTYEGDYEVTPKFTEQVLPTQGLLMRDDVQVHAIAVERVSNPQGGRTVYIGAIGG